MLLSFATAASPAAQDGTIVAQEVSTQQLLALARTLIDSGQPREAQSILLQLQPDGANAIERQFLLALAAEKLFLPKDAIALLRGILVDYPDLTRVRLELGRLLFETQQFTAARYHFDLALSQAPPGPVSENVKRFLREIQTRRGWSASLNVSIVPDSNANAAPAADTVELFGLPFELSDEARAQSQFGLALGGSLGFAHRAGDNTRLNALIRGNYVAYRRSAFDDASIEFAPSVDLLRDFGIIRIEPSVFSRWFGQQRFNAGGGLRVSLRQRLSPKMTGLYFASVRHADYRFNALDGQAYQVGARFTRALSSALFANAGLTYTFNTARDTFFEYQALGISGGIGREFSKGVTLSFNADIRPALYRDVPSIFGRRRKDLFTRAAFALTKRDWAIFGFAPVFRYIYARNISTIDLYRYSRHRGELGFTRAF